DKLWFFTSARRWGVDSTIPNAFYNLDPTHRTYQPADGQNGRALNPVVDDNSIYSGLVRLTYRNGPHKLAGYFDRIVKFRGHEGGSNLTEEAYGVRYPKFFATSEVKYTGTLTNKLLVEAGLSIEMNSYSTNDVEPSVNPTDVSRTELTGAPVGSPIAPNGAPAGACWSVVCTPQLNRQPDIAKVFATNVSYVTGSHAFKTGFQFGWGEIDRFQSLQSPINLVQQYRLGLPSNVLVYNTPTTSIVNMNYDIGMYLQDTWTLKRFTINPGIRFDLF